ncbi:sensor domain-containing diguanylate cyclase [Deinococcus sonorensis]|uniref:Diguanylate cyclase n=1 Tax=Deinococcus sonorensis KR-87 TaxID=694439 RepID=A0AAU7U9J8_9DEIO
MLATPPDDPTGQRNPLLRGATPPAFGLSSVNLDPDGVVRSFQTGGRLNGGQLVASFSAQLGAAANVTVAPSLQRRTLRYPDHATGSLPTLSFLRLISGTPGLSRAQLQGRVVLIGLTAQGSPAAQDVARRTVPQVALQARAVSSLLSAPFRRMPMWAELLLGVAAALATVLLRGFWGPALAGGAVLFSGPLWVANVQFPGVTLSLCAILGTLLVALERWWQLQNLVTRDPLTGLGNRLAFTRAIEHRWQTREERPIGLLLVDLSPLRAVSGTLATQAEQQLMRELAAQRRGARRRGSMVFRWGPDEFAVLLDDAEAQQLARTAERMGEVLGRSGGTERVVHASLGYALTGPDVQTPAELIERASRMRFRSKYRNGV